MSSHTSHLREPLVSGNPTLAEISDQICAPMERAPT